MSNSQKNFMTIRSKLLAAVAMLLVASFMVVSSTYAWFTLSTAPEVTGITTQIGANGNLEIALYTGGQVQNSQGGLISAIQSNATWGNIIDLSDPSYGLSSIIFKPSTLAVNQIGEDIVINTTTPLVTPTYGSDGRIDKLAPNGYYGKYQTNGFIKDDTAYGVRALGTVSTMTKQQLQYNTSSTAVKTNLESAVAAANISLSANGKGLVDLILKGATGGADATFTKAELEPVGNMITALEAVLLNLEEAVKNYLLLDVAALGSQLSDVEFEFAVRQFNADWETNFPALAAGGTQIVLNTSEDGAGSVTVPVRPEVVTVMAGYGVIADKIEDAKTTYGTVVAAETCDFNEVKTILTYLMDIEKITVGGKTMAEIQEMKNTNFSGLVSWAMGIASNIQIAMPGKGEDGKTSGVYADIASVTKNVKTGFHLDSVSVKIPGESFKDEPPIELEDVNVNMYTTLSDEEIKTLNPGTIDPPAGKDADTNAVISDSYAYVLDFAFRTNASGSNLMLQQAASDRIYGENSDTTSATWGGGSYMQFDVVSGSGFTADDVKNLMSHIRIVFVEMVEGEDGVTATVVAGGGLDISKATVTDGVTVKAPVSLCGVSVGTNKYLEFDDDAYSTANKQVITSLNQNEQKNISVYVYFDGVTVDNGDVAALTTTSATGKLNLQFASDAELKPMDYSDLKNQNPQTPANP